MDEPVSINVVFPPELVERLDEYGALLMPDSFNAHTSRGRSAVVRRLCQLGLTAHRKRLARARVKDEPLVQIGYRRTRNNAPASD